MNPVVDHSGNIISMDGKVNGELPDEQNSKSLIRLKEAAEELQAHVGKQPSFA